jgi:hypothetical protein
MDPMARWIPEIRQIHRIRRIGPIFLETMPQRGGCESGKEAQTIAKCRSEFDRCLVTGYIRDRSTLQPGFIV